MMRAGIGRLCKRLRSLGRGAAAAVGLRTAFLVGGWAMVVSGVWLWMEPGVALVLGGAPVFVLAASPRVLRWLA